MMDIITNKKIFFFIALWYWLSASTTFAFNRIDTLRGSNGSHRAWWDVQHYDLDVNINLINQNIQGTVTIKASIASQPTDSLQVDLKEPLSILNVKDKNGRTFQFVKDSIVYWILGTKDFKDSFELTINYEGKPSKAKNAPWDGGFVWKKDRNNQPWVAVACQGDGASLWWPCKDIQSDEPDQGVQLNFTIDQDLFIVSNGRLKKTVKQPERNLYSYSWEVTQPINLYNITFYIGDYVHWHESFNGLKGHLDLDYYVLRENESKAKTQFSVVPQMIECFENWFGPYPFYQDGYKLVESPYLGMEHQSAIAYGNQYKKGYLGMDRSHSGVGLNWDYIIIHESGHEWFGNNITAEDVADNWIHEGFTSYSEVIFTECHTNKADAYLYAQGLIKNCLNDKPIIGYYGVRDEGSGDRYDKGAAILHMIRMMINDDQKFKALLIQLNHVFYHRTVNTETIETSIKNFLNLDLTAFFNQYLRTTKIPAVEFKTEQNKDWVRLTNIDSNFNLVIPTALSKPLDYNWQVVDNKKLLKELLKNYLVR